MGNFCNDIKLTTSFSVIFFVLFSCFVASAFFRVEVIVQGGLAHCWWCFYDLFVLYVLYLVKNHVRKYND